MRRLFTALVVVLGLLSTATPASSAVPNAPFTETGCEGHSDAVARLYVAAFGRLPEAEGFHFWVGLYSNAEWSLLRMASFFVSSDEFEARFGAVDNSAFVTQLYQNVLGRGPDVGGLAFWINQLEDGLTRGQLLMRFSESPENITNSGTAQPILGPFNEGTTQPFTCDSSDVIELCNAYLGYLRSFDGITALSAALGPDAPSGVLAALDVLQDPNADLDAIFTATDSLSGYVEPICKTRWGRGLTTEDIDDRFVAENFFLAVIGGNEAGAEAIAPDNVRALFEPWAPIADDPQTGSPSLIDNGDGTFSMLLQPTVTVFCNIDSGIVVACAFGE